MSVDICFSNKRKHANVYIGCRFAQRMRCVANDFVVNVRKEPTAIIRKYEQDIAELQQELAMHDSITERHQITYGQYSDAQKAEVAAQVKAFLQSEEAPDSMAPLQLVSLRHMKEVLFAAKVGCVTCLTAYVVQTHCMLPKYSTSE